MRNLQNPALGAPLGNERAELYFQDIRMKRGFGGYNRCEIIDHIDEIRFRAQTDAAKTMRSRYLPAAAGYCYRDRSEWVERLW